MFQRFQPTQGTPPTPYLYTIHTKKDHNPYVIHLRDKEDIYQTAILSFSKKEDAITIANVLEHHKKEKGSYPNNYFTYDRPLELQYTPKQPIDYTKELQDCYIQMTKEEDMYSYCAFNMVELMVLSDLSNDPKMRLINFELPIETIRSKLEEKTLD